MKILVDCTRLNRGGGLTVAAEILDYMYAAPDLEVCVAATEPFIRSCQELFDRLVSRFKVEQFISGIDLTTQIYDAYVKLPSLENQFRPDVAYTIFGPTLWRPRAPHLVGFARPSLVFTEDRDRLLSTWRIREKLSRQIQDRWSLFRLRGTKFIAVESEQIRRVVIDKYKLKEEQVLVTPNTYSTRFSSAFQKISNYGSRTPSPFLNILVPSAYYKHKNLDIIPRVCALLEPRLRRPYRFILTFDLSSPNWEKIRDKSIKFGIEHRILNVGPVTTEEIAQLYFEASVVLLPSLLECSTSVYPEAFFAGVPLLTSDRDFAKSHCGTAAIYFDPLDPESISDSILEVIQDSGLASEQIRLGKEQLKNSYISPEGRWERHLCNLKLIGGLKDL